MNWEELQNILQRAIQPLKNKISLMIGRAILTAVNDGTGIQQCQVSVLAGESMDKVPHLQNYGFTSNPPKGSEGIVVALQGNREQLIIIATDDRASRLKSLAEGEAAVYNKFGAFMKLKADKSLDAFLEKIKIQNDTNELITVLSSLIQAIIDARTETAIGPMPLINLTDDFSAVKARLDTFKV